MIRPRGRFDAPLVAVALLLGGAGCGSEADLPRRGPTQELPEERDTSGPGLATNDDVASLDPVAPQDDAGGAGDTDQIADSGTGDLDSGDAEDATRSADTVPSDGSDDGGAPDVRDADVHADADDATSTDAGEADGVADDAADVAEPDIVEPDIAEPDIAEPDVAESDVAEPDVEEPDPWADVPCGDRRDSICPRHCSIHNDRDCCEQFEPEGFNVCVYDLAWGCGCSAD